MSRTGKIARLPEAIREQVNTRLLDGEPSKPIADWLNSESRVKAILAEEFRNRPITEANLSEWRAGGYQEWKALHMVTDMFHRIHQTPSEQLESLQGGLVDRMATFFAAEMFRKMKETKDIETTPEELVDLWREFRLSFASLRRYQLATVLLRDRLRHGAAGVGQSSRKSPGTDDEQEQLLSELLGIPGSAEANTFDPVNQTWSGPNAELMNVQHRKLLLKAAREAGFDPAKFEEDRPNPTKSE
jgi:hypothetical protein